MITSFTVEMTDGIYLVQPMTVQQVQKTPIIVAGREQVDPNMKIGAIIEVPKLGEIDYKFSTDPNNPVRFPLRFKRGDVIGYDRASLFKLPVERPDGIKPENWDGGVVAGVPDRCIVFKFNFSEKLGLVDVFGEPLA